MSRGNPQIKIRPSERLKALIEEQAKKSKWSMNTWVLTACEEKLARDAGGAQ